MIDEITPKEHLVCLKAARRYGLANPSFSDIIDELTPDYRCQSKGFSKEGNEIWVKNTKPCDNTYVIERWTRLKNHAMSLVDINSTDHNGLYCENCDKPLRGRQVRYCQHKCRYEAVRASELKNGETKPKCKNSGCNEHVKRKLNKYCSPKCQYQNYRREATLQTGGST